MKRVLGVHGHTDIRELIAMEMDKLIELLTEREDEDTTGGGKRAEIGTLSLEEELESFLEACALEEAQTKAERHYRLTMRKK